MVSARPPTRKDVHRYLLGILSEEISLEEAADWAGAWVRQFNPEIRDPVVWRAVVQLAGADLMVSPGVFLHTEPDFHRWLDEFEEKDESPPNSR